MNAPDPFSQGNPANEPSDEFLQQTHAELLHKKPVPKEGLSFLPLVLLGFISSMIFVVAIYFVHHRAGFDPLAFDERYDARLVKSGTAKQAVDPLVYGKKLYAAGGACITCHQANGAGLPNVYPPLAKSEWVQGSEDRLIRIVLHGLGGEIKVAGATFNGAMPAFGPGAGYNWTDDKIAAVLTYIRQEWGNTAGPVTTERVKEVRTQAAAGRTAPWTQAELLALP